MYDELLKALRCCGTPAFVCTECPLKGRTGCSDKLIWQAVDAIEELSAKYEKALHDIVEQEKPKWISVTERVPEKAGIYLVWTPLGFGNHLATSYWSGEQWTLRVVAWMQSPKPYEPLKEEGNV